MYYVYVIRNEKRKMYIGQTVNLILRLKRHNGELATKNKSYTHVNKGVWKIVYEEIGYERLLRVGSSTVEQQPFKLLVQGSNPCRLT